MELRHFTYSFRKQLLYAWFHTYTNAVLNVVTVGSDAPVPCACQRVTFYVALLQTEKRGLCLSVCQSRSLDLQKRLNRDVVWGLIHVGPRNHVSDKGEH